MNGVGEYACSLEEHVGESSEELLLHKSWNFSTSLVDVLVGKWRIGGLTLGDAKNAAVLTVMEACRHGSLAERLLSDGEALSLSEMLHIASGLAHGLAFLHGQEPPLIHRDLKPDNVRRAAELASNTIAQRPP